MREIMKILLVCGSFPPMKCGVGDYTALLAKSLGRRKDTSVAILTHVAARSTGSDFSFELFPVAQNWQISDAIRIVNTVRAWRPDIMHIQYPGQGYGLRVLPAFLPTLFHLLHVPVVQTWHEYLPKGSRRHLLNAILPGGLVAVRPHYKAIMPSWYRWLLRHKHFQFIPNASAVPRVHLSDAERSAVRTQFARASRYLIVFFGFIYPLKGIELLFEVADPARDHLVLVGDLNSGDPYHASILERVQRGPWAGKVTTTGFLPAEDVGRLLAAADAVVLPFRDGGGVWSTSVHGAAIQGTFVLTTSRERHGYDPSENIYYARPDGVADMRQALNLYIGNRTTNNATSQCADWDSIADTHVHLYRSLLS